MSEESKRIAALSFAQIAVLISLAVALVGTSQTASAQSGLRVAVDEARIVPLVKAPVTVIVGNPAIADVSVQNGNLLVVMGKNYGTTNVIALDSAGEEIGNLSVNVATGGRFEVSLHRGSARTTLNCAPMCEEEMNVGDSVEQFDKIFKQTTGKMGLSDGTAQPDSASE